MTQPARLHHEQVADRRGRIARLLGRISHRHYVVRRTWTMNESPWDRDPNAREFCPCGAWRRLWGPGPWLPDCCHLGYGDCEILFGANEWIDQVEGSGGTNTWFGVTRCPTCGQHWEMWDNGHAGHSWRIADDQVETVRQRLKPLLEKAAP